MHPPRKTASTQPETAKAETGPTPMPHERDESSGQTDAEPQPVMEQARRDSESAQVDTDMRQTPGLDADKIERAVKPGK